MYLEPLELPLDSCFSFAVILVRSTRTGLTTFPRPLLLPRLFPRILRLETMFDVGPAPWGRPCRCRTWLSRASIFTIRPQFSQTPTMISSCGKKIPLLSSFETMFYFFNLRLYSPGRVCGQTCACLASATSLHRRWAQCWGVGSRLLTKRVWCRSSCDRGCLRTNWSHPCRQNLATRASLCQQGHACLTFQNVCRHFEMSKGSEKKRWRRSVESR